MKASELRNLIREEIRRVIQEGQDSKPIKSFKIDTLAKIFTKIGFPTSKVEVYDNVNTGPTLSVVFKKLVSDTGLYNVSAALKSTGGGSYEQHDGIKAKSAQEAIQQVYKKYPKYGETTMIPSNSKVSVVKPSVNDFIDAYTDFQFDSGALGSTLPDIESANSKGVNKWEFQMQK